MKIIFASLLLLPSAGVAAGTNAPLTLVPPYQELPPTFWEQYHLLVISGGIALLPLMICLIWLSLRAKPATPLPPAKIARDALEPLRSRVEDGKLLSAVSAILRHYIGSVRHFTGGGMTTLEFTAAMAGDSKLDPQFAAALTDLLRACDKDKFVAQQKAPPLNAVARALQFIDLVESAQAPQKTPAHQIHERRI